MCCLQLPLVICTPFPIFLAMTDKLPEKVIHTIWVPIYFSNSLQFSLTPLYASRTGITKVIDPVVADVIRHLIIKCSFCSIKQQCTCFLKIIFYWFSSYLFSYVCKFFLFHLSLQSLSYSEFLPQLSSLLPYSSYEILSTLSWFPKSDHT